MSRHTCQLTLLGLASWLALAGCSETVVLGTECPESLGSCADSAAYEPADAGATEPLDATLAEPDGSPRDAATPAPDADQQEGGALASFANGSFELQANGAFSDPMSQFGKDVFVGTVGTAVPVADELFANLQPWYACLPGTQSVRMLSEVERATDGLGFVSTAGGLRGLSPGLYQRLATPLQPGNTYHFTIDVQSISAGANDVVMELGAGQQACVGFAVTTRTPKLQDGQWQTVCLTLTPQERLDVLGLLPVNLGATSELAFDNLRSVRSCP